MKLWVDDYRYPPDNWVWAQTLADATHIMQRCGELVDEIALDHDLGGDDTIRPLVLWMAEHQTFPPVIQIITDNPVGREWMEGMIGRYAPESMLR